MHLASDAITGTNKGTRSEATNTLDGTMLCFCFKDTLLSATWLNFYQYLVLRMDVVVSHAFRSLAGDKAALLIYR